MGHNQKDNDDSDMYLRKVFVGGVKPETSDQQFRQYFEAFGELDDCIHIRNKETKASKGFGFVTFSDNADVDSCLAAKPHNLNGKEVEVKRAVPRDQPQERCKKIFIGGLPDTNESDLKDFFETFGRVTQCQFKRDTNTGKGRGFGFVSFEEFDTVDKLVIMKHVKFQGRDIECKKALNMQNRDGNSNNNSGGQQQSNRSGNPSVYGHPGQQQPAMGGYPAAPQPYAAYPGYPVAYGGAPGQPMPGQPPVYPTQPYPTAYPAPGAGGYPAQPMPSAYPNPYGQPPYAVQPQAYAPQQAPSAYGAQKNTHNSSNYKSSRGSSNYKPY